MAALVAALAVALAVEKDLAEASEEAKVSEASEVVSEVAMVTKSNSQGLQYDGDGKNVTFLPNFKTEKFKHHTTKNLCTRTTRTY